MEKFYLQVRFVKIKSNKNSKLIFFSYCHFILFITKQSEKIKISVTCSEISLH